MRRDQRQPCDTQRQQIAHADGVAAQQVLLQGQDFVVGDPLVGELAEAGVDAVDRLAAAQVDRRALMRAVARRACGRLGEPY